MSVFLARAVGEVCEARGDRGDQRLVFERARNGVQLLSAGVLERERGGEMDREICIQISHTVQRLNDATSKGARAQRSVE